MDLPTLKQKKERDDMTTIYKLINKLEVVDNNELLLSEI